MENLYGSQQSLIKQVRKQVKTCEKNQQNVLDVAHTMRQQAIKDNLIEKLVPAIG